MKRRPETIEKLKHMHLGKKHPEWRNQIKSDTQGGEKHWQYGKKASEETKKKKSESMKKFHAKNPSPRLGTKQSPELRKVNREKNFVAVLQCDRQGVEIKEWASPILVQEAISIFSSAIVACCRGKNKSAGGYTWRYKQTTSNESLPEN